MMRCAYKAILTAVLLLVLLCGLAFAETTADGFEYSVSGGKVTITGYTGKKKNVTIPEEIEGLPVVEIGDGVFFETSLVQIYIPDSVTKIGNAVFAYCAELRDVRMSKNIRSIGEEAFAANLSLRGFRYDGAYQADNRNLILPESLEYLGESVFDTCGFTSIYIPGTLKFIPNFAFRDAMDIQKIVIGEGVEIIGDYAFKGYKSDVVGDDANQNLVSVTLPSTLKAIENEAFSNLWIEEVVIPNSVTRMGAEVFTGKDGKFVTAYLPPDLEDINEHAFVKGSTLYCVKDSASYNWAIQQEGLTVKVMEEGQGIVELHEDEFRLGIGNTHQLKHIYIAAEEAQFTSSNPSVATVDAKGVVTGVGSGEAEITLSGDGKSLKCKVYVGRAMDDFSVRFSELIVTPGDCFWIPPWKSMLIQPGELLSGENLVYESRDESVISIDGKYMTAEKKGRTVVTIYDRFNPDAAVNIAVTVMEGGGIELPKNLKVVQDMAFSEMGAEYIRIPEGIEHIQRYAFSDNKELRMVRFEGMEVDIETEAFQAVHDDCVFLCYQHSMAHDYAEGEWDIPCVFFKK